jgi:hypothetical protein
MNFDPSGSMPPVASQLGGEFVGVETIVAWMLGEHAQRPAVERAARNLIEQQRSSSVLSGGISFVASVLHVHASMPDDHEDLRKQKQRDDAGPDRSSWSAHNVDTCLSGIPLAGGGS